MNATCADVTDAWSELEQIDLDRVGLDPVWARTLPSGGARRFQAIALCRVDGHVVVATSNPRLGTVRSFVSSKLREPFTLVRADQASIRRMLRRVYSTPIRDGQVETESESCPTVRICSDLLRAACIRGASDIHLTPIESGLQSTFRVDGELEPYREFDPDIRAGLVSRIKVLAGLNIAEKREPQDGRFTLTETPDGNPIDVRVATIPARHGERATLRLLAPLHQTPSLADLGMSPGDLQAFTSALDSSSGLILLTGPTGCGKSTTLSTAITQRLHARGGNIITVEDPVEYEIPGITQVEVDSAKKVTFSRALRSILRHDPDVIMLGEIRDAETAELAIKASLTGHLVFSTLHTNTAAGVVTRLADMGIEPFLIASTLRMAIAQRLVRKLCPHCQVAAPITTTDAVSLGDPSLTSRQAYAPSGCVYCAGKGFNGRTALFEMLPGGADVSDMITDGASEADLTKQMRHRGVKTMTEDGIDKVLSGTTTAQQVLSAVTAW